MKPTQDELIAAIVHIEKLSPAPRVLCRAMALLRSPHCDVRDVVMLVRVDTALTAELIRGANSAFYGADDSVSSLDRAVQKIGFRESIRLLNLAVAHTFAARDLGSYGISADAFWAESLWQGLFLSELAKATKDFDPDIAHTAGLLRFIGRLAINEAIAVLGVGLFWDGQTSLEEWEHEHIGFTQDYAAGKLLRAWLFPEDLCVAIECQSDPTKIETWSWLAHALAFSTRIAPPGSVPDGDAPPAEPIDGEFADRYDLTTERLRAVLSSTRAAYGTISQHLY